MSLLLTLKIFNYWTPFSSAFIVHFEHEIIARFGVNSSEKKKKRKNQMIVQMVDIFFVIKPRKNQNKSSCLENIWKTWDYDFNLVI